MKLLVWVNLLILTSATHLFYADFMGSLWRSRDHFISSVWLSSFLFINSHKFNQNPLLPAFCIYLWEQRPFVKYTNHQLIRYGVIPIFYSQGTNWWMHKLIHHNRGIPWSKIVDIKLKHHISCWQFPTYFKAFTIWGKKTQIQESSLSAKIVPACSPHPWQAEIIIHISFFFLSQIS